MTLSEGAGTAGEREERAVSRVGKPEERAVIRVSFVTVILCYSGRKFSKVHTLLHENPHWAK